MGANDIERGRRIFPKSVPHKNEHWNYNPVKFERNWVQKTYNGVDGSDPPRQ